MAVKTGQTETKMIKTLFAASIIALSVAFAALTPAAAETPDPNNWDAVLSELQSAISKDR